MKIMITGSTGYLAGRIVDHLLKNRPDIELHLVNRSRGGSVQHPRVQNSIFTELKDDAFCDLKALFHFAGPNAQDCHDFFEKSLQSKIFITKQLLDLCKINGIPFRYFSSIHVYGSLQGNITEDTPINPTHLYGYLHRITEELCEFYHAHHRVPVSIFRLANAIGAPVNPEVKAWSLISNDLCRQAVEKKSLRLNSDGHQLRSFLGISKLCEAFDFLLDSPFEESIYNLAGDAISMRQLTYKIQKTMEQKWGLKLDLHFGDSSLSTSNNHILNISSQKWIRHGGPSMNGTIENEIAETLTFCKKHFSDLVK